MGWGEIRIDLIRLVRCEGLEIFRIRFVLFRIRLVVFGVKGSPPPSSTIVENKKKNVSFYDAHKMQLIMYIRTNST